MGDVAGTASQGLTNISTGAAAGMQLGGPAGAAVGAVVGAGATIATLPQKIMEWSQALVDSRDHLVQWNGHLQMMKREAMLRGVSRDIESARETAPAANVLNKNLQDLLDEIRPLRDDLYKLVAAMATGGLQLGKLYMGIWKKLDEYNLESVKAVFSPIHFALEKLGDFADWWMDKETNDKTTIQMWAKRWNESPGYTNRVPRR
jgi:hypothetical protein